MQLHPQGSLLLQSNLAWPVAWTASRHKVVRLWTKVEHAIRHLVRTPKGSLLVDPDYGTLWYRLRTQGITDEDAIIEVEDLRQQMARYIPQAMLVDTEIDFDREQQHLGVWISWVLPGADPSMYPGMQNPQKSYVSL